MAEERAVLAGGCFWGMQDLIRKKPGVKATRVGYTGGKVVNATYRNHDGHAEAIEILFDPSVISFRTLLEFFFQIHDPTTKDRQGNDRGSSYRSAIFTTSDEQMRVAEDTIADVEASGLWPGRVVTEVVPAGAFWEAEPEHQDYLQRIPNGYTCHFVRPGWKLPHRATAS
jgi:peptide-methionine (S)-S-oxide reductase